MLRLDVLNECLETMGQAPLASLDEQHPLRAPALARLDAKNSTLQARGWWFNMENATLSPDTSGKIILPGDCLTFRSNVYRYTKRGAVLYDMDNATDLFTKPVEGTMIRLIPFEDLEEQMAEYVAAVTIQAFQLSFDGDTDKQSKLSTRAREAFVMCNAEHTRQMKQNSVDNNYAIQRIRGFTRQLNFYPR